MGAFLDKPKTEKQTEGGAGNGLEFGLSSMQGWRVEMEDAHLAQIGLPGLKDWSAFAVLDGHAGGRVSAYCAENLLDAVITNEDFKTGSDASDNSDFRPSFDELRAGLRTGFLRLDDRLRNLPETLSGEDRSGTTVVCSIVTPTHIVFANCGDSRAVHSRAGRVFMATVDHKPMNPIEKERIQNAGGSVMIQRVNGSLAVSRALGDFEYKNVTGRGPCEQLVSPEPEITIEERTDDDEFIALACDGVWDVMSNEELCDFVRSRMMLTDDLQAICSTVIDTCLSKGSRDNMSIIIVAFSGAPKVCETALAKEAELNARIEAKVKEIVQSSQPPEAAMMQYVMHLLAVEDIEGLPPGGGISAKRDVVEAIVNRLGSSLSIESPQE